MFKEYGARFSGDEDAESYFGMLLNYQDELGKLDQAIEWEEILTTVNGEQSLSKLKDKKSKRDNSEEIESQETEQTSNNAQKPQES